MREIYLMNPGDSVDKVKYEYKNNNLKIADNKIWGNRYIELDNGSDDILIVRNYLPYYMYRVQENETIMDIMAKGYEIGNVTNIQQNDLLILKRPRSIRYVVRPLQSINDIANELGITPNYIIETNVLKSDKLFVGQILWL